MHRPTALHAVYTSTLGNIYKMKKAFKFLMLFSLFSCNYENKATFVITNNTLETLDSVRLKSNAHEQPTDYIKLEPNETKVYSLNMANLPKVDGEYSLTYISEPSKERSANRFGYFTNGHSLEDTVKIAIHSDTLMFDFIRNQKY